MTTHLTEGNIRRFCYFNVYSIFCMKHLIKIRLEDLCFLENLFRVTIFSNATFPIECCRDIVRADHVIINLGAADKEGYQKLYGRNYFIKVLKNIRELIRLRPILNPNFYIEVVIVLTSHNREDFLNTERLVQKLGVDYVQKIESDVEVRSQFDPDFNIGQASTSEQQWQPCLHGWFYSTVNFDGNVHVCCFMERLAVGNAFGQSFKDVWRSPKYAEARVMALTGKTYNQIPECIHCRGQRSNKKYEEQLISYNQKLEQAINKSI